MDDLASVYDNRLAGKAESKAFLIKNLIMTIIVGLICKDAIVLASDSQTTSGTSKRCDAKNSR
jgi:20S proteasome alpha/beta subunit